MKTIFTILGTALVCLVFFGLCVKSVKKNAMPKEANITIAPNSQQIAVGPTTKTVDIINKRGKKMFTLHIRQDGKILNIQREGDAHINVQPKP